MVKLSDYVIDRLAKCGIKHVFQLIGGAISHLVDSTIDHPDIMCITMHHEQAAAFAAEGYARTGMPFGVAMATSGPGATNLITAIGSCYFDSVPCVFITGQVNSYEYKFDHPVRQVGFQETDIVSIIKPIVKGAKMVLDPNDIKKDLDWAIHLATSGRPGPVLLDLPMNIQRAEIKPDELESFQLEKEEAYVKQHELQKMISLIQEAKRPLILAGGGVRASHATQELHQLIELTHIPLVSSLMGVDVVSHQGEQYIGMIGAYGNRSANLAVANCDLLLILGSRLDTRQTGTKPLTFARAAKKIQVDVDVHELNRVIKVDIAVQSDLAQFLKTFNQYWIKNKIHYCVGIKWKEKLSEFKTRFPFCGKGETTQNFSFPNLFLFNLTDKLKKDAIIVLDVGQHQMWASQSLNTNAEQRIINSGGMGAMGFALPVAIGAAFANPEKQIVVISGDGGFQINIQELETIFRNKLQIKIIILNNNALGMVKQFQQVYFNNRTEGTVRGYSCPNFVKIANAYNIKAYSVDDRLNSDSVLQEFLSDDEAALLNVVISQQSEVMPKLIVNQPIENQDPKLSREELTSLMLIPLAEGTLCRDEG